VVENGFQLPAEIMDDLRAELELFTAIAV